jgi:hypothetical protein
MSLGQRYIDIDLMATDGFKIFSERAALPASGTTKRPAARPRERTSVTPAPLVTVHTAWIPRSCRWNNVKVASTPYAAGG